MLLLFPVLASAQRPDSTLPAPPPPPRPAPLDTSRTMSYFYAQAPERGWKATDTLPDLDFRMYDPARRRTPDWATLGNLGTPARPLWFETLPAEPKGASGQGRGFDIGAHGFDLYRVDPTDLRFYKNSRSFSEVFFSQGQKQDDGMFNARLARTFSGGSTFSFDYRTFNNLGQYRYQLAKHTSLAAGLWVPLGQRYDGFLIFSKNVFRQQDNGGIVTDTVFGQGGAFSGPIDAEVRLANESAQTRFSDWTLQLTQHLKFNGGNPGRRVFRASHTIAWNHGIWKFLDTKLGADTTFFGDFVTDRRGLRNFIELGRLDNSFTLNTFKQKTAGRPSDALAVGITHSWFDLYQEPLDSTFSNFFLTGNLSLTPSDRFAFTARGELGMLANFGEYHVSGDLTLGLGKAGQLRAAVLSQRRPPTLLQYRTFVSFDQVWANSFAKPLETSLSATYALPLIGFEATGRTHLVSNYLYFDQNARPAQTTAPLQIAQLLLSENLRLGPFRFDNTVGLQRSNRKELLHLPDWFLESSLYFKGKMFKKRLDLTAGADFRLNSAFRPDAYQPLFWQFHLQDTLEQKPYPWLDLFVAFKVRSFRVFVRYENFLAIWTPEKVFYQTANHPQPFNALRFGISWRFLDSNLPDTKATKPPPGSGAPGVLGPTGN